MITWKFENWWKTVHLDHVTAKRCWSIVACLFRWLQVGQYDTFQIFFKNKFRVGHGNWFFWNDIKCKKKQSFFLLLLLMMEMLIQSMPLAMALYVAFTFHSTSCSYTLWPKCECIVTKIQSLLPPRDLKDVTFWSHCDVVMFLLWQISNDKRFGYFDFTVESRNDRHLNIVI